MKTEIEIVTGFLGAGKTGFIEEFLKISKLPKEKVLVIQMEQGEKLLNSKNKGFGLIIKAYNIEELTESKLNFLITLYKPHRVIFEFNGTANLEVLFKLINSKDLKAKTFVGAIYNVIEASTFDIFIRNIPHLLIPFIIKSNLILLTNFKGIKEEDIERIQLNIKEINNRAFILVLEDYRNLENGMKKLNILDKGILKNLKVMISEG